MYDGTLASKGPWQALVTFQQMIVLADQDGVVDMTAHAIARRTSIPLEIIERGIETLMEPDPHSRTPDDEGRRIVLLEDHRNWGWQIVNHKKYRDWRKAEDRREYLRTAKAKSRAKAKAVNSGQQMSTSSTDTDTDADTASKAEAKTKTTPRKRAASAAPPLFDDFWLAYPKKVGKPEAMKAFAKLEPEQTLLDEMLHALSWQRESDGWRKDGGQFIPNPATWLNQARWTDEPTKINPINKQTALEARNRAVAERFMRGHQ